MSLLSSLRRCLPQFDESDVDVDLAVIKLVRLGFLVGELEGYRDVDTQGALLRILDRLLVENESIRPTEGDVLLLQADRDRCLSTIPLSLSRVEDLSFLSFVENLPQSRYDEAKDNVEYELNHYDRSEEAQSGLLIDLVTLQLVISTFFTFRIRFTYGSESSQPINLSIGGATENDSNQVLALDIRAPWSTGTAEQVKRLILKFYADRRALIGTEQDGAFLQRLTGLRSAPAQASPV